MEAKLIGNYGGDYGDADGVQNPETDIAAAYMNRALEDLAQTTRTIDRASVNFTTVIGGAPPFAIPTATIDHDTVWGSGAGQRPTITKTAQGLYTVEFPTPQTDDLGVSEGVAFLRGLSGAMSSDPLDFVFADILTIAANVITLQVGQRNAAPPVAQDQGNNSAAAFEVTLFLR